MAAASAGATSAVGFMLWATTMPIWASGNSSQNDSSVTNCFIGLPFSTVVAPAKPLASRASTNATTFSNEKAPAERTSSKA